MTNLLENRFRADDIAQAERHLATESPTDIDRASSDSSTS